MNCWTCVIDEGEESCILPGDTCVNSESCCSSKDRCYANVYQEPKCWGCKELGSGCRDDDECCDNKCIGGECVEDIKLDESSCYPRDTFCSRLNCDCATACCSGTCYGIFQRCT